MLIAKSKIIKEKQKIDNKKACQEGDTPAKIIKENIHRSSHRRCSVEKGALRNFAKSTGQRLCQSLFFNKVADLRPENGCHFCIFFNSDGKLELNNELLKLLKMKLETVFVEAVARRCSVRKVFLEILQNSQENTCARIFFYFFYLIRDSGTGVFL